MVMFQEVCVCLVYFLPNTWVWASGNESEENGKDQEKKQSSTTPNTWKSNKNTKNTTNKSQEANPFPAGDHMAAMN